MSNATTLLKHFTVITKQIETGSAERCESAWIACYVFTQSNPRKQLQPIESTTLPDLEEGEGLYFQSVAIASEGYCE